MRPSDPSGFAPPHHDVFRLLSLCLAPHYPRWVEAGKRSVYYTLWRGVGDKKLLCFNRAAAKTNLFHRQCLTLL